MTSTERRYLLDTDTCIYIINCRPPSVRKRLEHLMLVSNNLREFKHVEGLQVESWVEADT